MKKSIFGALIVALVFVGAAAFEYSEAAHQKRFHAYMEDNNIEYTDGGCEQGWNATTPDHGLPIVLGTLTLCFVAVLTSKNLK